MMTEKGVDPRCHLRTVCITRKRPHAFQLRVEPVVNRIPPRSGATFRKKMQHAKKGSFFQAKDLCPSHWHYGQHPVSEELAVRHDLRGSEPPAPSQNAREPRRLGCHHLVHRTRLDLGSGCILLTSSCAQLLRAEAPILATSGPAGPWWPSQARGSCCPAS